jgi:hypothetical protein
MKREKPEDLVAGDKLGYFIFQFRKGNKFFFYERVGLKQLEFHFCTVQWLINVQNGKGFDYSIEMQNQQIVGVN